jgi:alanyl-tRNA synthetase
MVEPEHEVDVRGRGLQSADYCGPCSGGYLLIRWVHPANDGVGMCCGRSLRRGIRYGRLGRRSRLCMMVRAVRDEMQVAYPELKERRSG